MLDKAGCCMWALALPSCICVFRKTSAVSNIQHGTAHVASHYSFFGHAVVIVLQQYGLLLTVGTTFTFGLYEVMLNQRTDKSGKPAN